MKYKFINIKDNIDIIDYDYEYCFIYHLKNSYLYSSVYKLEHEILKNIKNYPDDYLCVTAKPYIIYDDKWYFIINKKVFKQVLKIDIKNNDDEKNSYINFLKYHLIKEKLYGKI